MINFFRNPEKKFKDLTLNDAIEIACYARFCSNGLCIYNEEGGCVERGMRFIDYNCPDADVIVVHFDGSRSESMIFYLTDGHVKLKSNDINESYNPFRLVEKMIQLGYNLQDGVGLKKSILN